LTDAVEVRRNFEGFVVDYMLHSYDGSAGSAAQVATDLYGARCALLHTQTAESNLTHQGQAREVHYRSGNGTGLVPVTTTNTPTLPLIVDPRGLLKDFQHGVDRLKRAMAQDQTLATRVYERATFYFDAGQWL